MSRIVEELRERKKARKSGHKTPFKARRLEWCLSIDWKYNPVDLDEARETAQELEQAFLLLAGAVDLYDLALKFTRNNAFEHTQVSITQRNPKGDGKPTVVNIRAADFEDCCALALHFLSDYADIEFLTLISD